MAHHRCAISIPDTNGAPGGAPLVKITNGVLLMAHHRCAINGHIRCAISRGFSSSAQYKYSTWHLGANGYLIKLCSKDSSLLEPRFTYAKLDRPSRVMPTDLKNVQDQVPV